MNHTPLSMRKHIAIFGATNAGKSTLFNALIGQEAAIVSEVEGTTTDPIVKAMELIPYGPIAVIDTAGLGDRTILGQQRVAKSMEILKRTNLIIHVVDGTTKEVPKQIDSNIPSLLVYTKCDLLDDKAIEELKNRSDQPILMEQNDANALELLKKRIVAELQKQDREDETLLGDLLPPRSTVVLVVPIDSAAPKGRIILPQVQVIRDCLDHGMKAIVTKETTLQETLQEINRVDLVVTDSQAFALVDKIVPAEIPLTSFSMLLARQKGNFLLQLRGAKAIENLRNDANILILEGCTHNTTHEDIGRVKLPALLRRHTEKQLNFSYKSGYEFPNNLQAYDLVISCGMCMINRQEVQSRLRICEEQNIPVTNYGIALAYLNGILDRASQIFLNAL